MPVPPNHPAHLRRQAIRIISGQIIPRVQLEGARIVTLALPPEIIGRAGITPHPGRPLVERRGQGAMHQSYLHRWFAQRLESARSPCLTYVVEGEADIRVGITENMMQCAERVKDSPFHGCDYVSLTLGQGSIAVFPAGVPHSDGSKVHWERPHIERAHSHLLWLRTVPTGGFLHTCLSTKGNHVSERTLFLQDSRLHITLNQLIEEMAGRPRENDPIVQTQLLLLMHYVRRLLERTPDSVALTELSPEAFRGGDAVIALEPDQHSVVRRAIAFIESNLHSDLGVESIAAAVFLSPAQLNRVFRSEMNQSLMKYVVQRRLEVARDLLAETSLSVRDVGRSVGYLNNSYFTQMFTRSMNTTPAAWRKAHRRAGGTTGRS